MHFGLWLSHRNTWDETFLLARRAEEKGWDGIWYADHLMPVAGDLHQPVSECWTTLAALSASVPRVRLGSLVSGNTYRHPAMLAKQAATTDHISGGRIVLGVGTGWQRNEHVAFDIYLPPKRERLARLEEACLILVALLHGDPHRDTLRNYAGRFYSLSDAPFNPKPFQDHLPLLIGGGGEQVTLKIVARLADEWNIWGSPEVFAHKWSILQRYCVDVGRDAEAIRCSVNTLLTGKDAPAASSSSSTVMSMRVDEAPDLLASYARAGVDEIVVCDSGRGSVDERSALWDDFLDLARTVNQ